MPEPKQPASPRPEYAQIDELARLIIELVNERTARPDCDPAEILGGQLCAVTSFMDTIEKNSDEPPPVEFYFLQEAARMCLRGIRDYIDEKTAKACVH